MVRFLGLDIGGANLKLSDGEDIAKSAAFPLWKMPERLAEALGELTENIPAEGFAVTMTGELADCFETKARGVNSILAAVEDVAGKRPVFVWQTGAEFVSPEVAREIPLLTAAANWHALATWVGRMAPVGLSLMLDMGSTTTDIVPICNGVPIPAGFTDRERLKTGELVYTGVRRTPLCAVAQSVPFRGELCPVAAEFFASTLDVYLLLEQIAEDETDSATANGKPATRAAAHDRLARMICCDRSEVLQQDALGMAAHFAAAQRRQVAGAIKRVLSQHEEPVSQVILSGSGDFLLSRVCDERASFQAAERILLSEVFREDIAEAALRICGCKTRRRASAARLATRADCFFIHQAGGFPRVVSGKV